MRTLSLIHRWTGGLLGLLLATLALSGTLLLHRDLWLRWTVPHAADPIRLDLQAEAVQRLMDGKGPHPTTIVLAGDALGVHRLLYAGSDAGAYADQSGAIVVRWTATWQRPELWLFDLHRHLLSGATGETIVGCLGLAGLLFVVTGAASWWSTRRTFAPRLLPRRASRSAIVRHHRDIGILVAPLLVLSFLTGAMMALRPVERLILSPGGTDAGLSELRTPASGGFGATAANLPWSSILARARSASGDGRVRLLTMPARPGAPIVVRVRRLGDPLPSGRTSLWFDPADGRLVAIHDPTRTSPAARIATYEYPLHAAKVGSPVLRILLTLSGLVLAMLGMLAPAAFWSSRIQTRRSPARRPVSSSTNAGLG